MSNFFQDDSNDHFSKELQQEKIILEELEKEVIEKSNRIEKEQERLKKIVTKNSTLYKELQQESTILDELSKTVDIGKDEFELIKSKQAKQNPTNSHTLNEIQQEKEFLVQMNSSYEEIIEKLKITNVLLEEKISDAVKNSKELEQESIAQNEIIKEQTIKLNKKQTLIISLAAVGIAAIGISSFLLFTVVTGHQYEVENVGDLKSGYVVQNLKGDTIDTWLSWRMVQNSVLHVGIVNADKYPDKIPLIKEIILSDEVLEIDDSLLHKGPKGSTSNYFVGWSGALNDASQQPTEFHIPVNLEVVESSKGEGEITIFLSDKKSGDGYSGYTNNIADQSQNQILKSSITIYDVNNLSKEGFKTILRHELGHAFGLAHSTATEDLMYPEIKTNYPYISQCDISALKSLYDGGKKSEVVCEK